MTWLAVSRGGGRAGRWIRAPADRAGLAERAVGVRRTSVSGLLVSACSRPTRTSRAALQVNRAARRRRHADRSRRVVPPAACRGPVAVPDFGPRVYAWGADAAGPTPMATREEGGGRWVSPARTDGPTGDPPGDSRRCPGTDESVPPDRGMWGPAPHLHRAHTTARSACPERAGLPGRRAQRVQDCPVGVLRACRTARSAGSGGGRAGEVGHLRRGGGRGARDAGAHVVGGRARSPRRCRSWWRRAAGSARRCRR